MMWGNWGYGAGFGFGWIFMVIFWGLIIWAVVSLIRNGGHGCCGMGGHDHGEHKENNEKKNSALDILKERYAKGEINKQEFEEKRKDLQG